MLEVGLGACHVSGDVEFKFAEIKQNEFSAKNQGHDFQRFHLSYSLVSFEVSTNVGLSSLITSMLLYLHFPYL